jgi:hypothetical protein
MNIRGGNTFIPARGIVSHAINKLNEIKTPTLVVTAE